MDMLWIKVFSFASFFCSANLSCFMIAHIFKDKKVAGDVNSLNLLVLELRVRLVSLKMLKPSSHFFC